MLTAQVTYSPRLGAAEQRLLALPNRLRNFRVVLSQSIAPVAAAMLTRHWESKGAAFGHPWAPWKPSTLAARTRKGNVAKGLLRDTDALFRRLFRSLQSGERIQQTPTGVRLSLGITSPEPERLKALFHQRGTKRMVARQIIPQPLPRSFRSDVRAIVRDFVLTGRLRGAGGRFTSTGGASGGAS